MNGNAFEPVSTIHYWSKASIGTMLEKDWAVTPRYSQLYRENELIQITIGRELYTGPRIYINGDVETLKRERFKVAEIGYDKNREINLLAIANKAGTIVYRFGNTNVKRLDPDGPVEDETEQEAPVQPESTFNIRNAMFIWCQRHGINLETFGKFRQALIAGGVVNEIKSSEMTPEAFDELCRAISANFGDQLKESA